MCAQSTLPAASNLWVRNLWNSTHWWQRFILVFCYSSIFSENSSIFSLRRTCYSYKFSAGYWICFFRKKKKKGVKVYCLCFYLLQTLYKLFLKVFAFTYLITFTLSEPSHNPRERKSYLLWDKTHHHHHQKTQKPSPVKPDYLTENQTPHGEWCMHTWPSWVGVTDTVLSDMKCLRSYLLTLWLNQRYRI